MIETQGQLFCWSSKLEYFKVKSLISDKYFIGNELMKILKRRMDIHTVNTLYIKVAVKNIKSTEI